MTSSLAAECSMLFLFIFRRFCQKKVDVEAEKAKKGSFFVAGIFFGIKKFLDNYSWSWNEARKLRALSSCNWSQACIRLLKVKAFEDH